MFNPLSSSAVPGLGLAKALDFLQQIRRLLSQKSDCSFLIYSSLYRFQGSCALLSLNAGFIISKADSFVNPFRQIFSIF